MEYLILTGVIAAVVVTVKGLVRVMNAPQPEPRFELPTKWEPPAIPDFERVYPRRHATANPVFTSDSPISVISEPSTSLQGFQPFWQPLETASNPVTQSNSASVDIVALLALTPFAIVGTITADEFQLFSLLKDQRRKQTEIIKTLYHVARGGTQAYDKARDRYLHILKLYLETKE